MTQPNRFKNESQDARRHDQQHVVHPPMEKGSKKLNKEGKIKKK